MIINRAIVSFIGVKNRLTQTGKLPGSGCSPYLTGIRFLPI